MPLSDSRLPPQDLDAEMALLGAMLMSSTRDDLHWDLDEIRAIVRPEAFYMPDHAKIARCVYEAHQAGEPIDLLSIGPRLNALGRCEAGDWTKFTVELAESFADLASAPFYARAVRAAWLKRELIRRLLKAVNEAYGPLADGNEIIGSLVDDLNKLDELSTGDREPKRESELLRGMANPRDVEDGRIPVAIGQLGYQLDGGLELGSLSVIGARPSCGKTSLGLGLCVHASRAADGRPSMFASCEMSWNQIAQRLLAMRSGLSVRRIRSGDVEDSEFEPARNKAVLDASQGCPVFVLDGVRDVRAIAAQIRKEVRRNDVALATVDYLQLCHIEGKFERHDLKIGAMTGLFKSLALDLNIAVVLLSQLSRASAAESRRPRLSDLRDSGNIEQDADNIILIHKDENATGEVCDTTLIVAKQRQGDTGDAYVVYRKPTMSYHAKHVGPDPSQTCKVCNM